MTDERLLRTDSAGWLVDENGLWARAEKGVEVAVNRNRWLYDENWRAPVKSTSNWSWPTEVLPAGYYGSGSYVDIHPSRWGDTWRSDVEVLARQMVDQFGCSANTYYCHPPYWCLDSVSADFWSAQGRGYHIGHDLGQAVFDAIFHDPNPPWIRWCIWEGWIWIDGVGWSVFPDDGTGLHFDHPHFTFH